MRTYHNFYMAKNFPWDAQSYLILTGPMHHWTWEFVLNFDCHIIQTVLDISMGLNILVWNGNEPNLTEKPTQ